ncbi:MAG: CPXCG motif-containing cysteine-rich protein [Pseudomonadota bacterium]|nr:CPXCG motif-containing cysteine-rich protein [Pseudomonadota bacterium]
MLDTKNVQCPYCWESFELVIDPSETHQEYVEDCFVCCRPIHLTINIDNFEDVTIQALSEDEDIY